MTTAPPGAKVRVDGYLKGVTPAEVRVSAARWAPTRHRLTLDLDGHERSDEVLWLRAGEDRVVRRGLRKRVDMPALLAGFVPPGPVLEGYAAANLDADGDTELVVLAADPAGNATLVVYDVREDVLAECYRVAVGAQPRSLLPVE
ncbi:MAG: PEGA domain-containing protein, partial [Armatimonadetes bacterium]|nr:PEGA domain-containing protein [Armatimonadota bacterium]